MARYLFAMLAATWMLACASGPHPALGIAAKDFKCDKSALTLHEIYPKKVRVEGCDREAVYVHGCDDYGATATCGWVRLKK